jgi:hypothetical protein
MAVLPAACLRWTRFCSHPQSLRWYSLHVLGFCFALSLPRDRIAFVCRVWVLGSSLPSAGLDAVPSAAYTGRADKVAENSIGWDERMWQKNSWKFADQSVDGHHHFPLVGCRQARPLRFPPFHSARPRVIRSPFLTQPLLRESVIDVVGGSPQRKSGADPAEINMHDPSLTTIFNRLVALSSFSSYSSVLISSVLSKNSSGRGEWRPFRFPAP